MSCFGLLGTDALELSHCLPTTRYRGSKRRYASFIAKELISSEASMMYDAFGGSGSVTALADALNIKSHYNDFYEWTASCARVLFVHSYDRSDLTRALEKVDMGLAEAFGGFITNTYDCCYFTHDENQELDGLLKVMSRTRSQPMKELLFYGIAQATLVKMPMSMFHRASLKQRITNVKRRSGNKVTWNRPFGALIREFIKEAVAYGWQRNLRHVVTRFDALDAVSELDSDGLLFLDPPYINSKGGVPTYAEAYHFLEGFIHGPYQWEKCIDTGNSHPIFHSQESNFELPEGWMSGMQTLLDRAIKGNVIATARENDDPGARQLKHLLKARFKDVTYREMHSSTIFSERQNREYVFLAT